EKLIEEIIETERLSSRHGALNKESKDLVAVIQELIDDFYADAGLDINLPEQPVILELDVARLKLLLKNLIDNSLRHTPVKADPPAVTLTQSRVKVEIEVEDRGVGVDAEHLPHLTEPFYRVDPARQRSTGGYGLGLYLCQMIVDAHQGSLLIESKMGKGTKIVVALPR
ncbi:sensor histidine kinase, partial [Pseudomonadota bacterium]